MHTDCLIIAGKDLSSRLIVGTGKYKSVEETERAIDASGADIITVALRRVDLGTSRVARRPAHAGASGASSDGKRWMLLPGTAGCYTADEAVRTRPSRASSACEHRSSSKSSATPRPLYPDNEQTLEAARSS